MRTKDREVPQLGVHLLVTGKAVIAQADERIRWHKNTAAALAAELKSLPASAGSDAEEWKKLARRNDVKRKLEGHLEYARFLTFVRANIVRSQTYRLSLTDMSLLEIMPKGSYC